MKGREGVTRQTESLLNEADEFWAQWRHEPLPKVLDTLRNEFADLQKTANLNSDDAAASGRRVREQQELNVHTTVITKHQQITSQCMAFLNSDSQEGMSLLEMMSAVEQSLATNYDQEGSEIKINDVIDQLIPSLSNNDAKSKLRLIILLLATNHNISDANYQRVTTAAGLTPKELHVLNRLRSIINRPLDASLNEEPSCPTKKKGIMSTLHNKLGGSRSAGPSNTEWLYSSQRHTCAMKDLAESMVQNKLAQTTYPAVEGQPAMTGAKSSVAHSVRRNQTSSKKHTFSGPRSIIFCVGGITHEEMQSIYHVSKANEREVILGSTSIMSPNEFIDEVMTLANDFDE
uniref:Uncharacterized protein n=1 Tax=Octactis speculum TaxID=3111310 RepID=A0A7S2DRD5_9STRA|mmetsp:Transcript_52245/g.71303  ORF Transcript_52245/g.71303 Transcript_52245/m.71303 type:complete len:346 (+) Transcript_52245:3-1040(+)